MQHFQRATVPAFPKTPALIVHSRDPFPARHRIQAVTQWLASQGFSVDKIYSGKTLIEFSGTPRKSAAPFDNTTNSQLNSATLLNGQVQIPINFSTLGSHSLVAQYYGDTKNKPSTSANPLIVIQTGTTTGVWFLAATGSDTKQINLTLTVQ